MSLRVVVMLNHSILYEALRAFLSAQPGVEVVSVGQDTSRRDLHALGPDIILIEEGASVDVSALLGAVPCAKVIALTRDGTLTVYRRHEVEVARLEELLDTIVAG